MTAIGTDLDMDARAASPIASSAPSDTLLRAYVGSDPSRFNKRFNIAAGLWPPVWFLYRKMYTPAAVTLLAPILFFVAFPSLAKIKLAGLSVSFAGRIANRLYLRQAARTIARIEAERTDGTLEAQVAAAGGVSRSGAVFGILIIVLSAVAVTVSARLGQPK